LLDEDDISLRGKGDDIYPVWGFDDEKIVVLARSPRSVVHLFHVEYAAGLEKLRME
jgi:hypothetical protein